jgi:peptidoglycan/xylan/chitin deacetylase (PgdA/CDA1 family)
MSKFHWSAIVFAFAGFTMIILKVGWFILAAYIMLWLLFWFLMSFIIRSNFFINVIHQTSKNNVLLSFDDGPHQEYTPQILEVLKKHNAKAMFFIIGKNVAGNEQLLKRIHNEGHIVGNHTQNHKVGIGFNSTQKVIDEIDKCSELLSKEGVDVKYFRPPFGVTNPNIAKAIEKTGLSCVGWTLRSFDTTKSNAEQLLAKMVSRVKGGDVVLFHDTQKVTVALLDKFLIEVKKKGLTLNAEIL